MNTRDTTAFLQDLLASQTSLDEERISIEAGLNTEDDVIRYVNRICVSLEQEGYELPESFELGEFVKALEEEIIPTFLAEDAPPSAVKKQGFLSRAVGAVKGAVSRGVASAQTKLRRYHGAKADAAADKLIDPSASPKETAKAEKHYVKHYVKQQALVKKLNPETHAAATREKAATDNIKHGSKEDAHANVSYMKAMRPVQAQLKAHAPIQKIARDARKAAGLDSHGGGDVDEPMSGSRTASDTGQKSTQVTKAEKPTIKTQEPTVAMKVKPKV